MFSRPGYTVVCAVLGALLLFMSAVLLYSEFGTAIRAEEPVVVQVRSGESLRQVTRRLGAEGTLHSPRLLQALAVLRGDTGRIKAGEYVMQGHVSPAELLGAFVSGRATYVRLTIPEGLNLQEVADRVEATGLGSAEEFMRLAGDADFLASLDLPFPESGPPLLEGFIFPETYFLYRGVGSADVIHATLAQFRRRVAPLLRERAAEVGLTPYEALILASIIEKETGQASERRLISSVFHNRLEANMLLGSDPTVIYGVEGFDGNLTRAHLRASTPYNTYTNRGLPPTPITNPGLASIRAALNPAESDYLYFVSRGDGSHVFNKDLESHNRAVWKYQKAPHRNGNRNS